MNRDPNPGRSAALGVVIALLVAMSLSHWSVCEQDDSMCMFTGQASK